MVRDCVRELERMGAMPSDETNDVDLVERWEVSLHKVQAPVTDEEAFVLSNLFGPDTCFGLGWTLLHLIETAPGWPVPGAVERMNPEWFETATQRIENARRLGLLPKK
ncbi:hypothetical protein WMF38_42835 [Sorangium sp. So ce118]